VQVIERQGGRATQGGVRQAVWKVGSYEIRSSPHRTCCRGWARVTVQTPLVNGGIVQVESKSRDCP